MTDRSVTVRLKGDISDFNRAVLGAAATTKAFTDQLDTSNDRMTNLVQSSLAFGPALVPIGAAAIPAIGGLTNQLAFATAGVGAAVLAFGGLGDGLKALNEYQLEPTATNLNKVNEAMAKLGPAGREFAVFLQDLRPELQRLQDSAQAGLFPGLQRGITDLMTLSPQVEQIIFNLTDAFGDLAAEAGANLAGPEWAEFFNFLEREAKPTLTDLGRTLGNLAQGFAQLWMAFDPLSDQFSKGFLQMSRDFNAWATGLDQTEGFQNFLDYVSRVSPKVWETLGAVGNAIVEIVEAAAPVGEATLPVIEALADAIATIADSPLGPTVIALASITSAIGRIVALSQAASGGAMAKGLGAIGLTGLIGSAKDLPGATRAYMDYGAAMTGVGSSAERMGTSMKAAAKLAGGVGGLAFVMSDLDDKLGLTNTAMGAMVGSMAGPWGAAIGATVGGLKDLSAAFDDTDEQLAELDDRLANASLTEQAAMIAQARTALMKLESVGFGDSDAADGLRNRIETYDRSREAAMEAAFAEANLSSAMNGASESIRTQTFNLLENVAAKNRQRDAALSAFSAETDYQRALADAREGLKGSKAGLDATTEAGRKNRDLLEGMVTAWNRMAETGASAEELEAAKRNLLKLAEGANASKDDIQTLIDALHDIPDVSPEVDVDTGDSMDRLRSLQRYINGMHGKTVKVHVEGGTPGGITTSAYGGLITGPGGPRDDVIPALLSNREYVIQAPMVEKYGVDFFDALNAGRFADGGLINGGFADRGFTDRGFAGAVPVMPQSAGVAFPSEGVTASIEGARFRLDTDGFMTAIDGRIRMHIAGNERWKAAGRRRGFR